MSPARIVCAVLGHKVVSYAARKQGRHIAGTLCRRCATVLTVRAGSRQERRRVIRQRVAA